MADLTTLARVKEALDLDPDFVRHDKLLKRLVSAQSALFINLTKRSILTQAFTETVDGNDGRIRIKPYFGPYLTWLRSGKVGYELELRNTPVVSITTLKIDGEVIPAATNLNTPTQTDGHVLQDGHRLILAGVTYTFTPGVSNVEVVYQAGYGATPPEDVQEAVIEMVMWVYKSRDTLRQVQRGDASGSVTFSQKAIPESAQQVIDLYTLVNV
jgi:hypothetical protein